MSITYKEADFIVTVVMGVWEVQGGAKLFPKESVLGVFGYGYFECISVDVSVKEFKYEEFIFGGVNFC